MSRRAIQAFFDTLSQTIEPKSELDWETPLDLTIAVVLSAQATDVSVNKATKQLWQRCRTTQDYLDLGEDGLRNYIKTIGLYRNKARAIIGLCEQIQKNFNDEVPATREELQSLPGVGRKTANVILNVVFDQPTLAVDTHIFRVANRIGLADAKTPESVEKILLTKIPANYLRPAHHYLILHGRYTCKARRPLCHTCTVHAYCNYPEKSRQQSRQTWK